MAGRTPIGRSAKTSGPASTSTRTPRPRSWPSAWEGARPPPASRARAGGRAGAVGGEGAAEAGLDRVPRGDDAGRPGQRRRRGPPLGRGSAARAAGRHSARGERTAAGAGYRAAGADRPRRSHGSRATRTSRGSGSSRCRRDEAERMLDELAGGLPARVKDAILPPAEGNPFFVEEVLQSSIDRGVLRRERARLDRRRSAPPGRACRRPSRRSSPRASICCPRWRSARCRLHRWSGGPSGRARCASSWPRRRRTSGCSRNATSSAASPVVARGTSASTSSSTSSRARWPMGRCHAQARAVACELRRVARAPDAGGDRHAALLAHHYAAGGRARVS